MNKKSSFERVVGVTPELETEILEHFQKKFKTDFIISVDGKRVEKEKSPELNKCIEEITQYTRVFLAQYGVSALDIRPGNVKFVDTDDIQKKYEKRKTSIRKKQEELILQSFRKFAKEMSW